MEEQELLLRNYLQGEVDPVYLEEQANIYQALVAAEISQYRFRDTGDAAQAIMENALALEELVYTRLGKRAPCSMCPRTQYDRASVPASEQTAYMHLRCGHKVHTHCFLHTSLRDDYIPSAINCPVCITPCVEEEAMAFFRRNANARRTNVINLWETNPTFRTDLKKLMKLRRETMGLYRAYAKEVIPILREYKQTISVSVQAIAHYKKEYKTKLREIVLRRKMLYGVGKFNDEVSAFTKKYQTYLNNLRALRGVKGAPYIPANGLTVPWRYRRSPLRFLRTVV